MKLLSLKLKSFKGIESFELDTGGQNVSVYGDNATGKTTLFDAFLWLLFDVDSQGRANFEIKSLNKDGQPIHGLNHSVEAVLEVGGKAVTLKKVYKEKWTKKRGSAKAEFTGHTTDYFIDSVPVKKSEYLTRISEITDENIFRLLTDPTYFNTQLHWEERRKILMEVCGGGISDSEVIESNRDLAELPKILQGKKLKDYKRIVVSRCAKLRKELVDIPIRIDEVKRNLPDIDGADTEELKQRIAVLKKRIQEKEQQVTRIQSGGQIAELIKEQREVETRMLDFQNTWNARHNSLIKKKQGDLDKIQDQILSLQSSIKKLEHDKQESQEVIDKLQSKINTLKEKFYAIRNQQLEYEESDTCPTCGQSLSPELIAEAKKKALAEFNRTKAEEMEAVNLEGKKLASQKVLWEAKNKEIKEALQNLQSTLAVQQDEEQNIQKAIGNLRQAREAYTEEPVYVQMQEKKQALEEKIAELKDGNTDAVSSVKAEITSLEKEVEMTAERLNDIQLYKQGQERIKELEKQETDLAEEYEQSQKGLHLIDLFVRTKIKMLDKRINSKFELARFKLVNKQVNGAIEQCCETMYQGVPYSSLNNAARINVGLDIIRTLSKYYNFKAPVFIDNAESVVDLVDPGTQVIRLVVQPGQKKLHVENHAENKNLKEAV